MIPPYTLFPTLDEVIYLHEQLIARYGGTHGFRDIGLLESALNRPQSGYYDCLSKQAAALLQSLLMNHVFIDGNKRVAFALTVIFLKMNGYGLHVSPDIAEKYIIDNIIIQHSDVNQISQWLELYMKRV